MTTAEERARTAQRRAGTKLSGQIRRIRDTAKQITVGIPELDEDPDDDDPVNLWLLTDGRLSWRTGDGIVRRTSGTTSGSPISAIDPEPDPEVVENTGVYPATWARTYCSIHGIESGPELPYGDAPQHSNCGVMIGLDSAAIQAALVGATIQQVEIRVLNTGALEDRVTIQWGTHTATTPPAEFTPSRLEIWSDVWPAVGFSNDDDDYHEVDTAWLGRALADGTATGLVIAQPSGLINYGRIDWATFAVAITYT